MLELSSASASAIAGAVAGACTTLLVQAWWRRRAAHVFELGGLHYELIGYAWDHQVKDFKVVYRPLYDCSAKKGSFERHTFAVSHFSRWEEKFTRVGSWSVPLALTGRILSWPSIGCPPLPVPGTPPEVKTSQGLTYSGFGTRSLEVCKLDHVIGDYHAFIDVLQSALRDKLDVSGLQMDHICYRCETMDEYKMVVGALQARFGQLMTEADIGGRPVATVLLHQPIDHPPFQVEAIEVASPKPGRPYRSGLEHAEIVVGSRSDGFQDNRRLLHFMREHPALTFDQRALNKEINADVSLSLDGGHRFGSISVKFHQRPLVEVVRYEIGLEAQERARKEEQAAPQ